MKTVVIRRRLIPAAAAAAKCGKSTSGWLKDWRAGRTPAPIRLGRSVRWDEAELDAWISAGCPCRERWETIKEARHA